MGLNQKVELFSVKLLRTLVKKIKVFSPEKNGDTQSKLRLFRAECGQLGRTGLNGCAGQLGHIQW
jgi:hypothetical protein